MSPNRLEHLHHLAERLTGKTKLCEVLSQVDAPRAALLGRLRELAEDHLQFGSALRRMVDESETQGDACAV